jgi:hypothetical protein
MRSLTFTLAVSALTLAMGAGMAQAQTVIFDTDGTDKAIGIENLSYNGDLWNVGFTDFVSARNGMCQQH